MLEVFVYLLPALSQKKLWGLFKDIAAAAVAVPELRVSGERDVFIFFPPDQLKYGVGEELLVHVASELGSMRSRSELEPAVVKFGKSVQKVLVCHLPGVRVTWKDRTQY